MNLIHKQVYHCQFGEGTVTDQTATVVTVEFCEKHGAKKFLYPSAFEAFLMLYDSSAKAEINNELQQIRLHTEEERQKREKEAERLREEAKLALLEQKRAAAKKRPSGKKI